MIFLLFSWFWSFGDSDLEKQRELHNHLIRMEEIKSNRITLG